MTKGRDHDPSMHGFAEPSSASGVTPLPERPLTLSRLTNRVLSGVLAFSYIVWGFVQGFGIGTAALVVYTGICSLIWYGDGIGSIRWSSRYRIAPGRRSPGKIIAAVGWFLLVGLPIVMLSALKDWRP